MCIFSKQNEADVYLRQVHLGDELHLRFQLSKTFVWQQTACSACVFIALLFIRLQSCSCSACERTAAPPPTPENRDSTCLRDMLFSLSLPINAFISTWKMRDYFPIPQPPPPPPPPPRGLHLWELLCDPAGMRNPSVHPRLFHPGAR